MALSVAQWGTVSDWFSTGNNGSTKTITGLSWSAGDIIVVITGVEGMGAGGDEVLAVTPTNANLTFGAAQASSTSGGATESGIWVWAATAGSSQSSQTITITLTKNGVSVVAASGGAAWVVAGSPTGTANATANLSETNPSLSVGAGSVVVYGLMDWNATNPPGKTPITGSGSATERLDQGNGSNYAQWLADWVGTAAGTFSFGPDNYTSLKVAQVVIEVTAPAGAVPGLWNSGVRRG